jgi:hypothetical protein
MNKEKTNTLTIILTYEGEESKWEIRDASKKEAKKVEKQIDKIYYDLR